MSGYFCKEGSSEPLSGYQVYNTVQAQGWGPEFDKEDGFEPPQKTNVPPSRSHSIGRT